jgi:hypothetical protein
MPRNPATDIELALGTLENGADVVYTPGGEVKTGRTNTLGRPIFRDVPYTYTIRHSDGEVEELTTDPDDHNYPETRLAEMLTRIGEEYGWQSLTAEAYVVAYGTVGSARSWPESSPAGHTFVGVANCQVIRDWTVHGDVVGLYRVSDRVEPYVVKPGVRAHGMHRLPDDAKAVPLPDSQLKNDMTFQIPEDGNIGTLIRDLEDEGKWHTIGEPYEISDTRKVSSEVVQVADSSVDKLRKRRIIH